MIVLPFFLSNNTNSQSLTGDLVGWVAVRPTASEGKQSQIDTWKKHLLPDIAVQSYVRTFKITGSEVMSKK